MFDRNAGYPTAVASNDDEGMHAAIRWCIEHLEDGDTLRVWTFLKSNLRNCAPLERLVNEYSRVEHVVGRGGAPMRGNGPVLMAWPDMDDIGQLVQYGSHGIRALCVIVGSEDRLRPWVTAVRPAILGDGSAWADLAPELDPLLIEELKSLTLSINHNNTIAAGFEKNMVVSTLLALHDVGIRLDGEAMQAWALANGWSGKNPQHLAKYVKDINTGKRPRAQQMLSSDYLEKLRIRAAGDNSDK
ncbi:hypothetical protein [Actinomadura bangladeshensis]|uniref:Uncharacterized protein n=1 Tax=Actinomadura bangladeshensis TaxID=453573 RepID=A0A4R4N9D5_9ACTN|nr:hypothetical protein [Actinomadura bangladeshensis]TDC05449.1 hypothetical protein E1284_35400 [Actinomadura bangladeshensis]